MPYDYGVDTWSIGCTLFELYTGKILFAGDSNNQMLKAIMEIRGRFTPKLYKRGELWAQHFNDAGEFVSYERDKVLGKVCSSASRILCFSEWPLCPLSSFKRHFTILHPYPHVSGAIWHVLFFYLGRRTRAMLSRTRTMAARLSALSCKACCMGRSHVGESLILILRGPTTTRCESAVGFNKEARVVTKYSMQAFQTPGHEMRSQLLHHPSL